jgi:hypothetical protein
MFVKEISEEEFEKFKEEFDSLDIEEQERFDKGLSVYSKLSEKELVESVKSFDVPVEKQKEIAAYIEHYVKFLLEKEASTGGFSEGTRKWIVTYTDLLDRIHKNVFGEKRVNFDLKLSHAHLSSLINKYKQEDVIDVACKGVGESESEDF